MVSLTQIQFYEKRFRQNDGTYEKTELQGQALLEIILRSILRSLRTLYLKEARIFRDVTGSISGSFSNIFSTQKFF